MFLWSVYKSVTLLNQGNFQWVSPLFTSLSYEVAFTIQLIDLKPDIFLSRATWGSKNTNCFCFRISTIYLLINPTEKGKKRCFQEINKKWLASNSLFRSNFHPGQYLLFSCNWNVKISMITFLNWTSKTTKTFKLIFRNEEIKEICFEGNGTLFISVFFRILYRKFSSFNSQYNSIGRAIIQCLSVPFSNSLKRKLNFWMKQLNICLICETKLQESDPKNSGFCCRGVFQLFFILKTLISLRKETSPFGTFASNAD